MIISDINTYEQGDLFAIVVDGKVDQLRHSTLEMAKRAAYNKVSLLSKKVVLLKMNIHTLQWEGVITINNVEGTSPFISRSSRDIFHDIRR